jgi:hypothetical protein
MKSNRVVTSILTVCGVVSLAACGTNRGGGHLGTEDMSASQGDLAGADFAYIVPPPPEGDGGIPGDPTTCAEAVTTKSYIGCDYWPTVTANPVWSVFDFAAVISNPGANPANITISGGALTAPVTQTVAPGTLVKAGLPWVTALKGPDFDKDTGTMPLTNSTLAKAGAYHLTSDVPVLVYQFNALEYKAGTGNDLNSVAWSTCPNDKSVGMTVPCDSFSNDASLLLPSTAMTPNYVISGVPGDSTSGTHGMPQGASYAVITATADSTTVKIQLSKTASIVASTDGTSVPATAQNATTPATVTYSLSAGDVLQLVTAEGNNNDLTGSLVEASAPVQLIVGKPCTANPVGGQDSCDHIEAAVLPIETWGKQYIVTAPSGPEANVVEHSVRIYGGTAAVNLTYAPAVSGAPAMLAAGAVATFTATTDFSVTGDQPFQVSTEQMSGAVVDPAGLLSANGPSGDPSLSFFSAVEQYRLKYLFLAPTDYDSNYVNITAPTGTTFTLDGAAVTTALTTIGGGYGVLRITLSAGTMSGAHTLIGTQPFGIQIMGYGIATSYQYPGGLDLKVLSAPPPPIM